MRWEDEPFVKVYTRDTVQWMGLSFTAKGLFVLLLKKVDRAGLLPLGRHGRRAVAIAIGHPEEWERLEPALEELLADGCVVIVEDVLMIPNFIEAQEARQSDRERKRAQRERDRAKVGILKSPTKNVTTETNESHAVTRGHTESHAVTLRIDENRIDENRIEEVTPLPPKGGVGDQPSKPKPRGTKAARVFDEATLTADEKRLVEFWRTACDRPRASISELDVERLRLCLKDEAKLAVEFLETPQRLAAYAIKGCSLTPHNMGENEGHKRYNGLALIFRDPEQIRRFVDTGKAKKAPGEKKGQLSLESFRERDRRIIAEEEAGRWDLLTRDQQRALIPDGPVVDAQGREWIGGQWVERKPEGEA